MARNPDEPEYLLTEEAATFLRRSERTLTRYRAEGIGPRYHKHGGRVLYAATSLREWVAETTIKPVRS
jgi:hypothetical protein